MKRGNDLFYQTLGNAELLIPWSAKGKGWKAENFKIIERKDPYYGASDESLTRAF